MEKNMVKLTEKDLHKIVEETVKSLLKEDYAQRANYVNDNVLRTVQEIAKLSQNYINTKNETLLTNLMWYCSAFVKEYERASMNAGEVYNKA
jgi:hypothetical protein